MNRNVLVVSLAVILQFSTTVSQAAPATDLTTNISPGLPSGINGTVIEIAERFTIPSGQVWRITGITTDGFADPGPNYSVTFYSNTGGSPGTVQCQRTDAEPLGEFASSVSRYRNPELRMINPCLLGAGSYFVGLTTTPSSGGSLQINTSSNLIGSQSLARGSSCGPSFVPISSCLSSPQELQFRVRGCQAAQCEFSLSVNALCSGSNLQVEVRDGDLPVSITGTGPGLPASIVSYGFKISAGPDCGRR